MFSADDEGAWNIYTLSDDHLRQVTEGNGNVNPSWSPDGERILFSSHRDGDFDLYVMDSGGSNMVLVTDNDQLDSSADWSPVGSMIAFDRVIDDDGDFADVDETDFAQVFVAEFGTPIRDAKQLTSVEPNAKPRWSPDGTRIAFLSWRDGNAEIYLMNSDGSEQTNLTRHPGWDVLPAWSPDGSKIAFVSDRDGVDAIYVMGADGSDPTRVSDDGTSATNPSWSADGRHILYTSDEHVIYAIPAVGGERRRIAEGFVHECRP